MGPASRKSQSIIKGKNASDSSHHWMSRRWASSLSSAAMIAGSQRSPSAIPAFRLRVRSWGLSMIVRPPLPRLRMQEDSRRSLM